MTNLISMAEFRKKKGLHPARVVEPEPQPTRLTPEEYEALLVKEYAALSPQERTLHFRAMLKSHPKAAMVLSILKF